MTMQKIAQLLMVAFFSLGLLAGCGGDGGASADSEGGAAAAIKAAIASNKAAKKVGNEWRDTGKLIKKAKKAMKAGNEDKAIKLANKAKKQGEIAVKQAAHEQAEFVKHRQVGGKKKASGASLSDTDMSKKRRAGGAAGQVSSYSVVNGDNLWGISGKDSVYSNPYQWPLIYKTNRNQIKDADLIFPGQVFDIDQNASASEINAAVSHAKTRGAWSIGDVEQSDKDYLAK